LAPNWAQCFCTTVDGVYSWSPRGMSASGVGRHWHVYATRSLYVITESRTSQGETVSFIGISRESGVAQEGTDTYDGLQQKLKQLNGAAGRPKPQACAAILGCVTTHQQSFLLVVTEASVVADLDGQRVFEISHCEALPFVLDVDSRVDLMSTAADATAAVASVVQLVSKGFFFSRDFDITRRLQQRLLLAACPPEELMSRADDRYAWNKQLVEPLLVQTGVRPRWFSPIVQGFVQLRDFSSSSAPSARGHDAPLALLLIARRSCRRAGTRYNARGLDDEGETGNWVETEQLVKIRRCSATSSTQPGWISLVQVRGSAPVFWEQSSGMQGVSVTRGAQLGSVALEKHHRWLQAEYGDVLYASLLSHGAAKRDTEGVLSNALTGQLKMINGIKWKHLDFSSIVSGDENSFNQELDSLANQVSKDLTSFGFLDAAQETFGVEQRPLRNQQMGVIRTNCFDCLDRTNLLQQQLAWRWLSTCLTASGGELAKLLSDYSAAPARKSGSGPAGGGGFADLLGAFGDLMLTDPSTSEGTCPALQSVLRAMWADLGDTLSLQYTGAASTWGAALRKGGQSTMAMMEKGWNSVNRAYCARFEDGSRQAVLDLMLGKHKLPRAPAAAEARRAPCGQLTVAVVTWNVHCHRFWEAPGMLENLIRGTCGPVEKLVRSPDVVIFSFQEMLELSAANVVTQASGDAGLQAAFEAAAVKALEAVLGEPFAKVQGLGMVGLYIGAFVALRLSGHISKVAAGRRQAGLYGQAGNKGAVAVRFEVCKTAICALSVHLESGTGQAKASERAGQLREVLLGAPLFGGADGRDVVSVAKHDLVVVAGDFNFRLGLPQNAEIGEFRNSLKGSWPAVVAGGGVNCMGEGMTGAAAGSSVLGPFSAFDELCGDRVSSEAAEVLREASLMEGPVLFPATYRFLEGTMSYDSERIPAWCDRVLHSKVGVIRRRYGALGGPGGLMCADHRAVGALLETSLLAVPGTAPPPTKGSSAAAPAALAAVATRGTAPAAPQRSLQKPAAEASSLVDLREGEMGVRLDDLLGESPAPVGTSSARQGGGYPAAAPQLPVVNASVAAQQAAPSLLEDPLDFSGGTSSAAMSPAAASSSPAAAVASSSGGRGLPGLPLPPEGVKVGQFVLAEHAGGWFYANVTRAGNGMCDIAWRRPAGANWARDQHSERYFCSTGEDETCHGDKLPVATRIRLPDRSGGSGRSGVGSSDVGPAAPPAAAAAGAGLQDLLGTEAPSGATLAGGDVDLLG